MIEMSNVISKLSNVISKLEGLSWDEYNLHEDTFIDKYALDIEADKQPMLVAKWGMALSEAQKIRDKAKEKLLTIDADLFAQGKATKVNDKFLTDAGAKNWVKTHEDHKKASDNLIEAELHVGYLWAAKNAIDAKGDSIRFEGRLWEKGYFSRPAVSQKGQQTAERVLRDEKLVETSTNLKKRLQKKQL